MTHNIKKETFEDKFDRKWACFYQRAGVSNKIKTKNRKKFRHNLKAELKGENENEY